jgi:[CysO sulfur-carrier protein]-S-L-cysteine hydrolase
LYDAMVAHALAERPSECCGILAGVVEGGVGRVVERYPLVNALRSPTEFESEPRSMFDADRDMRRKGLDMLAVYHSHPTTHPVPSRKDRERSAGPDVACVIVSLASPPPEVRAWWLTAADHREAECVIEG